MFDTLISRFIPRSQSDLNSTQSSPGLNSTNSRSSSQNLPSTNSSTSRVTPISYTDDNYNRPAVQDTTSFEPSEPPEYSEVVQPPVPASVNASTTSGGIGGDNPSVVAGEDSHEQVPTILPDHQDQDQQLQFPPAVVNSGDVPRRSNDGMNGNVGGGDEKVRSAYGDEKERCVYDEQGEPAPGGEVFGGLGFGFEGEEDGRSKGIRSPPPVMVKIIRLPSGPFKTQPWSGEQVKRGITPKMADGNAVSWSSTSFFSLSLGGGVSINLTPAFWAFWLGSLSLVMWFVCILMFPWAFFLGFLFQVFWIVGGWHFTFMGEQPAGIGVWEYYFACWGRRRRRREQGVRNRVLWEDGRERLSFGYPFIARSAESETLRVGLLNRLQLRQIQLREPRGRAENTERVFDPWIRHCRYVLCYGAGPMNLSLLTLIPREQKSAINWVPGSIWLFTIVCYIFVALP